MSVHKKFSPIGQADGLAIRNIYINIYIYECLVKLYWCFHTNLQNVFDTKCFRTKCFRTKCFRLKCFWRNMFQTTKIFLPQIVSSQMAQNDSDHTIFLTTKGL